MERQRWTLVALFVVASTAFVFGQSSDKFRDARHRMVKECIEREGIKDPRVLDAMRTVPRHEFVKPAQLKDAYHDTALPIGNQQTISPPFVVAYMTETIEPKATDRVLEIGTGSGYQAAVLSGLVKDVYTIEIVEPLGKEAARKLKKLEYANVFCKVGDGYLGWPEHAPFDKIIVTCSPENVPVPLVEQLKDGGKLLIPLGERYQQAFHLFEKKDGKLEQKKLIPTLFVPMTGKSEDLRQAQPDPLHPRLLNASFEIDENKDGLPDSWHYQRLTELMTDKPPDGKVFLRMESDDPGRLAQALQGMAIDGRKIGSVAIALQVRVEKIRPGSESFQKPTLVIHFYDQNRKEIESLVIGPWLRDTDWDTVGGTIPVPKEAREAIIRIGLNGATGRLDIDDIRFRPKPR
ncbi:MAG: protein-L-isoaspartate(D-aspartate) O-methyltransferase [Planctomycetota bacterium]|nr:MAG: protein-L-isoaspartate(D-aspartate) O-methyltransferase [Planctomycetota bacterium]GDY07877.1 protein-L-isoaspartate O-methyltransferase [Planctomycetia bacterium]